MSLIMNDMGEFVYQDENKVNPYARMAPRGVEAGKHAVRQARKTEVTPYASEFSKRLKAALKYKNWSQRKLSDLSGVSFNKIHSCLYRGSELKLSQFKAIVEATGISADWYLDTME